MSNSVDRLEEYVQQLSPEALKYGISGPECSLDESDLDEIQSLIKSMIESVDEVHSESLNSLSSVIEQLLGHDSVVSLAKFSFSNYEQEVFESLDTSEEEKVAGASETANQKSIERLDELVDDASGAIREIAENIKKFINAVSSLK